MFRSLLNKLWYIHPIGVLFMCFNVDYRILHMSITEQATQDATHFYTLFYNAPPAIKASHPLPRTLCRVITVFSTGISTFYDGFWYSFSTGKIAQMGWERDVVWRFFFGYGCPFYLLDWSDDFLPASRFRFCDFHLLNSYNPQSTKRCKSWRDNFRVHSWTEP